MIGYIDKNNRILFVSPEAKNNSWITLYFKPNGETKRFVNPALPAYKNRRKAEENLQRYAKVKGLTQVEMDAGRKTAERKKAVDFEPVLVVDIQSGKIKINKIWPEENYD